MLISFITLWLGENQGRQIKASESCLQYQSLHITVKSAESTADFQAKQEVEFKIQSVLVKTGHDQV